MLEIQEEIDNEDDDEDLEILEEEEANVTPKATKNNKEKKFQPQILFLLFKNGHNCASLTVSGFRQNGHNCAGHNCAD